MRLRNGLFAAAIVAALSCGSDTTPLTQVMVVVDSDVTSLDAVRVRVDGMGDPKVAMASDLDERPLPRTIAVVHRGGPLGPIEITAEGIEDGSSVVSQRAKLSFARGRNVVLRLVLAASCVDKECSEPDETCREGECVSSKVDASELDDWSPKGSRVEDAGAEDADTFVEDAGGGGGQGGAAGGGRGGGGAGGGSGQSGSSGRAGAGSGGTAPRPCPGCAFDSGTTAPRGSLTCDDGTCRLTCEVGYNDADKQVKNGCEARLNPFGFAPSNFDPLAPTWTPAVADQLMVNCSANVDLGMGAVPASVSICGQQLTPMLVAQGVGAPELVVLPVRELNVLSGSKLRFTGSRPVALVVFGDAQIDGELDVSAIGPNGGAGSNMTCNPGAGGNGQNAQSLPTSRPGGGGGGGGGLATVGGSGAAAVSGSQGGAGGMTNGTAQLRPLRGGCSGGTGGKDSETAAQGGAGGGALQVTVAGTLRVRGTIAAAGGGGVRGEGEGDGGGGGGSGGALLLEATRIELMSDGWVTANGGGGGAGRYMFITRTSGSDGLHASSAVASGGMGTTQGGDGGDGAAGAVVADNAESPSCLSSWPCGGGGGGGGVGRIVLRAGECQLDGGISPQVVCSGF